MNKSNFSVMFPVWTMLALSASTTPMVAAGRPGDGATQTADDQKNNKGDVTLAAAIRKSIMADKTLSVAAHNVRIIAQGGSVTLRGPIKSEEERASVLAKARDIAGAAMVTDSMTVSPQTGEPQQ